MQQSSPYHLLSVNMALCWEFLLKLVEHLLEFEKNKVKNRKISSNTGMYVCTTTLTYNFLRRFRFCTIVVIGTIKEIGLIESSLLVSYGNQIYRIVKHTSPSPPIAAVSEIQNKFLFDDGGGGGGTGDSDCF